MKQNFVDEAIGHNKKVFMKNALRTEKNAAICVMCLMEITLKATKLILTIN